MSKEMREQINKVKNWKQKMAQKKFKVSISSSAADYKVVSSEKVDAFNRRLREALADSDREFIKKQFASLQKAKKIIVK